MAVEVSRHRLSCLTFKSFIDMYTDIEIIKDLQPCVDKGYMTSAQLLLLADALSGREFISQVRISSYSDKTILIKTKYISSRMMSWGSYFPWQVYAGVYDNKEEGSFALVCIDL